MTKTESYHDIEVSKRITLEESMKAFDDDYLAHIINETSDLSDYPYGGHNKDNYSPFIVASVQSSPVNGTCFI